MGKHSDDNKAEPDDDHELKVLVNKCPVCHVAWNDQSRCQHSGEDRNTA
jgi:predicted ArsR family transcriptional regulator